MPVNTAAAAIADPIRRQILEVLAERPRPAGEIAALFPVSRPAISRHLRVLRESGLVTDRVEGRHRVYAIRVEPLRMLVAWANQLLPATRHAPNLDALATEVHRATRDRRMMEEQQEEIA